MERATHRQVADAVLDELPAGELEAEALVPAGQRRLRVQHHLEASAAGWICVQDVQGVPHQHGRDAGRASRAGRGDPPDPGRPGVLAQDPVDRCGVEFRGRGQVQLGAHGGQPNSQPGCARTQP
jgi:hypothetical protein